MSQEVRQIPVLGLSYGNVLLREIGKYSSIAIDHLLATVDPETLFKSKREHKDPRGRAQMLLRFATDVGLVDVHDGKLQLTRAGRRYVGTMSAEDPFAVTDLQAAVLRKQVERLWQERGMLRGIVLALSLLATTDRVVAPEDLGRAVGAVAGKSGWRKARTFQSQGQRAIGFLKDARLLADDGRPTQTGRKLLARLDRPEHPPFKEVVGRLDEASRARRPVESAPVESTPAENAPDRAADLPRTDRRRSRVWWVNQGGDYAAARDGGFLWAPEADGSSGQADGLEGMRIGDRVIHYVGGQIRAIGTVVARAVPAVRPATLPGDPSSNGRGTRVAVDYRELAETIPLKDIPLEWRASLGAPFGADGNPDRSQPIELLPDLADLMIERIPQILSTAPTVEPDRPYVAPDLAATLSAVHKRGMQIDERMLRRYHLALRTRGFVILSGVSGTGKTWLTELYAKAVGAEYSLVRVAPSWTTNEDLLGYLNPLDGQYHDTSFSHFLRDAAAEYEQASALKRQPRPFHLVLDEMNLARVEYYFAKFLSAMEERSRNTTTSIELAPENEVLLGPNLLFVGTVNVDETTHGFADKVYDRAQLLEMELSRESVASHLDGRPYRDLMLDVWDAVAPVAPFAFRVLDDIRLYVDEAAAVGAPADEAIDEAILQKVLPKLSGADARLGDALQQLRLLLETAHPLSHRKVSDMHEGFGRHGFASFF